MNPPNKKRKHSSNLQSIDIYELLKTKLTVVTPATDEQPIATVVYKDGWDDERIAKTIDPELSGKSAAAVRKEKFGAIKLPSGSSVDHAQIEALEALVREVAAELHELRGKYNKLATILHIAKVVDCAHLTVTNKEGKIL